MRHWTIAFFVCMILCGIGVPSHAAEISGAWKIETHGGPVPLCSLVQSGNDLVARASDHKLQARSAVRWPANGALALAVGYQRRR